MKIICTKERGPIADQIRSNGVEVFTIGEFRSILDWKQHRKVRQIIREYRPHIIHGAVFEGVTMAAVNGFRERVPIIILEETSDPQNRSWKGHILMRFLCSLADHIIGVSPAATDYLINKIRVRSDKVILINNGVALPRVIHEDEKQKALSNLGISSEDVVIGSTGRMLDDNHKRFSDLIQAFSILVHQGFSVKLLLVGDGPERKNYEQLASDLGISDYVVFTGYQSDTALYYSMFDVFALVSGYEAFGLVLAEAMLQKLPVVATRVGGIPYIVDDQETGFLAEKANVDQIYRALEKLVVDKNLRLTMGKKGFVKAKECFTEERYVKDVFSLYQRLIKKKRVEV